MLPQGPLRKCLHPKNHFLGPLGILKPLILVRNTHKPDPWYVHAPGPHSPEILLRSVVKGEYNAKRHFGKDFPELIQHLPPVKTEHEGE